ncbi:MAG: LacI family transcriptional regulator [Lachnospiraceae bacterium]|nr:LacI family transcriptional regulator [Lachnospiraceae bacterium]
MKEIITIKDIARMCNVGVATVSRAINDDPGINEKTKEKVLETVRKYRYVPNTSARNLKMTESNTIALVVCGVGNVFFSSMYDDFQNELEKNGYDFFLDSVDNDVNIPAEAFRLSKEKRLKGIIFLGGWINPESRSLLNVNVPFVFCTVSQAIKGPHAPCPTVGISDIIEAKRMVDYLCDMGHRRIAIIAGVEGDMAVGGGRLIGYKQSLAEHGIEVDERLIFHMKKDIDEFTVENGYAVTEELIASGIEFTAVFCISDLTAMGAYRAIYDAGLKIPEDISVVGFDGIEFGDYMYPRITTMVQPRHEMAVESVRILLDLIAGKEDIPDTVFETELLTRDSVKKIN